MTFFPSSTSYYHVTPCRQYYAESQFRHDSQCCTHTSIKYHSDSWSEEMLELLRIRKTIFQIFLTQKASSRVFSWNINYMCLLQECDEETFSRPLRSQYSQIYIQFSAAAHFLSMYMRRTSSSSFYKQLRQKRHFCSEVSFAWVHKRPQAITVKTAKISAFKRGIVVVVFVAARTILIRVVFSQDLENPARCQKRLYFDQISVIGFFFHFLRWLDL